MLLLGLAPGLRARDPVPPTLAGGPTLSVRVMERLHPKNLTLTEEGSGLSHRVSVGGRGLRLDGAPVVRWDSPAGRWRVRCGGVSRLYPGVLSLGLAPEGPEVELLLRVGLDDYVAGAAASEGGPHPRPAFALALAAVVRTYALQHRGRHGRYDLCDLTHCQLFNGLDHLPPAWAQAARLSQGLALRPGDDGEVLFHGACGGRLETARGAWGDGLGPPAAPALDELDGRVLCRNAHFFRWERRIPRAQLAQAAVAVAGPGLAGLALADAQVSQRTAGGRAHRVRLRFRRADGVEITRELGVADLQSQYGRRYGWDSFLSADFDARWQGDDWVLDGRGVGHGVGLCMEGAREMAELGYSADEILEHYFPGRFVRDRPVAPLH